MFKGTLWSKHLLVDTGVATNEGVLLRDLNGDGKPEWIPNSWVNASPVIVWELGFVKDPTRVPTLKRILLSETGQSHGLGFGDINNDGYEDLLTAAGWLEHPQEEVFERPWKYHPDWRSRWSVPIFVRDLNKDGRNDIIFGNPHDYGLKVWYAESPGPEGKLIFREEIIDNTYSQLHCIHFADLNGDGRDELITGKRVRAHNGGDPGAMDPPIICYYAIDETGTFT